MYSLPLTDLDQVFKGVKDFWPQNKTILITGGTGFFGRWLVESIHYIDNQLKSKNNFIVISRQNPKDLARKIPALESSIFNLHQADLNEDLALNQTINYVIHAASDVAAIKKNSSMDYRSIFTMTQNLIRATRHNVLDKFLYISSGGVYSASLKPAVESDLSLVVEESIDSYAAAKRQSEILVNELPSACSARCFSFVGPFCDNHMAVMQMLQQESIIVQSPSTVRSFMYPTDLMISLFKLLFLKNKFQVYNVGSDKPISLLELAYKLSNQVTVSSNHEAGSPALAGTYYCPDMQRFNHEYGPALITTLDEALRRTRQFLNAERKAV